MANTTGKKFGGRSKGTPNKSTKETREVLQKVVDIEVNKLGATLAKLEPIERVNALAKLLPYILPKKQEVAVEVRQELTEEQRAARLEYLKEKLLNSDV